ncbi:MAG: Gldg family protein, partial [Acutalibacteraceae bacterium]
MNNEKKTKAPNRRLRYGGLAVLVSVVVIVGAVVLAVLADVLYDRFPVNLDLTADNVYAISDETGAVIDAIDKDVEIVAFFPENTVANPSTGYDQVNTIYKQIHEVWKQYVQRSNGKVSVQYVDLATYPTEASKYVAYGDVVQGSVLVRTGKGDNERFRLRSLSDFFSYSTDSYSYSYVYTSKVEQTTASIINAVLSGIDRKVMLLTGHGEDSQTAATLTDLYEVNGYAVEQINLASAQEIGADVTTAVIAAPTKDLSAAEITRLRDWLTNDGKLGRNLMVVVNTMAARADCPNLYEFLDDGYGIEVTDNLIGESDAGRQLAGYYGQVIFADLPESPVIDAAQEATVVAALPRQILLKAGTDTEKSPFNVPLVTFPESSRLVELTAGENAALQTAGEYPVVGMGMAVQWTYDNSGDESVGVRTNVVVCAQ